VRTVSTFHLYLLRAVYLLIAIGLGLQMWPKIIYHVTTMILPQSILTCMLWALSVLAALGIRYPLQMLPLLFFEMLWKAAWLLTVAWPLWSKGRMGPGVADTAFACLLVVIVPIAIPWHHVIANYVKKPGDRWRAHAAVKPEDLSPTITL
jgi:hypothetical protein